MIDQCVVYGLFTVHKPILNFYMNPDTLKINVFPKTYYDKSLTAKAFTKAEEYYCMIVQVEEGYVHFLGFMVSV